MNMRDNLSYRAMLDTDYGWLYNLLDERMIRLNINISHRRMPAWDEHVLFWESRLYRYKSVEVIEFGGKPCGYLYLSKGLHELGVQCFASFDTKEFYLAVIDHVLETCGLAEILANVNPRHDALIEALRARGFDVCQHTYRGTK